MIIMNPLLNVLLDNPIMKMISIEIKVQQDLMNGYEMLVDQLINIEDYLV
jgi:hypothetical protein